MFHKVRSASRLSFTEWHLFLQAWAWLLLFDIGLRTHPFPALQSYAARLSTHSEPPSEQIESLILTLKTSIDRARRNHLYPMTCLRRSLALQKMLTQRGIVTELKIGVHKERDMLSAHAWVEYEGKPIGEPEMIMDQYIILRR